MEGSSKTETTPPGLSRTSAMSGPLLPDPLEKLHSQTDSFLAAARLVRRGWTEDGNKTGQQFSHFSCSTQQPSLSKSDGNQGPKPAEICLKDLRNRRVPIVNSRRIAEDREPRSGKKADAVKQTPEGEFSAKRQAGTQMVLCSQGGVVRVWVSSCRTTCRQSRRFKAPMLPVIAEM